MIRLFLSLSLFASLLIPSARAGKLKPELMQADSFLASGSYRLAASAYRSYLDAHPKSARARMGLLRSYAALGMCSQALELVDGLRQRPVWGADAAIAEAQCRARQGDLSGARAAYEEAAWFSPTRSGVWMGLASLAADLGEPDAFEHASGELLLLDMGEVFTTLLDAEVALERGDDAFEPNLAALGRMVAGTAAGHHAILDARRWLDLDDPLTADRVLLSTVRYDMSNVQLALWRAEAARRAGNAEAARAALSRPIIQRNLDGPFAIEILARILVDEGDVRAAEELLATHPAPHEPEALASAWYVARARGDRSRADLLAQRWSAVVDARDRSLAQLVPIDRREPR